MSSYDIEIVGKIGSMALINRDYNDIDYNIFARIGRELDPSCIWVTSGSTEIGRIDYIKRNGKELKGTDEEVKTDYSAQGQSILMKNYREFIDSRYSVRQFLVEHHHFNDVEKRAHLKAALLRCRTQNAIPIINYNDAVSYEENRRWEIASLRNKRRDVVECIDNDETASTIARLIIPRYLLILTSVDGVYTDINDPASLTTEISGSTVQEVLDNISYYQTLCNGSSRKGAGGTRAKLEFIKENVKLGTTVIISNSKYGIQRAIRGEVPRTVIQKR
jgi:glutamate 5-kinase